MDFFAFPPISATLDAAYALLMGLASLLQLITGGASAAVAVVVLTLLVRTILIPTGVAQAKAIRLARNWHRSCRCCSADTRTTANVSNARR